jgi:hypothetical protein
MSKNLKEEVKMKKVLFVFLAIFVVILAFNGKVSAADTVQTIPPHFSSVTQKLENGIMFKSVLIGFSPQMSIESSGTMWEIYRGLEGYSPAGLPVCGLYTDVSWTGNGSYLTTPNWVYHFPNTVDSISDQWLYYNTGYRGTGEALTQGRFGIGIGSYNLYYYTRLLFTDVYWYGNYYPHYQ